VRTQAHLSSDVDALTEKVTPSRIVARRVDRAKAAGRRLTDSVMGSDDPAPGRHYDPYNPYGDYRDTGSPRHAAATVSDAASSAASTISDTASSATAAVQEAPRAVRRQTRGNPLAAGLIAFGAGWLVSSLLPASREEQRLAQRATEKAAEVGRPVADAAREAAMEVKDNLQEPAQQAVESVKDTASQAGRTVVDEGRAAAQDAQSATRDAASSTVSNSCASPRFPE
jgi:hypothetical protein